MNKRILWLLGGGLTLLGILLLLHGVELFQLSNSLAVVVCLKVEKDLSEISIDRRIGFDPYWLQDQFETLQSKAILYRVITNLNLTRRWAEKFKKPELLQVEMAYARLRKQIDVRQPHNTSLIEIKVGSEDPTEAAAIANEIAEIYVQHRAHVLQESTRQQIRQLEAELEKLNRAISNKQAQVHTLTASSGTKGSEARVLDDLAHRREKIAMKIIQDQTERTATVASLVQIVDRGQPREGRRCSRKGAAIALILGGLGSIVLGTVLLRKGEPPGSDTKLVLVRGS